ncbi:MAG TPA: FlgD immunoglobulin-like domain containing protein [bacterium]|nr:FlgD immunoglobulin-like domain containing protein [bacterium]HOX84495.1 FlgD immunoglobulin-like domain containing protein [bacterium]HPG45908.1 FlgD immunoglobulin-like domain containing protein [bacterium]HPM97730.1 FlgD immunoglobulin-like domain containing protein [bacterium]
MPDYLYHKQFTTVAKQGSSASLPAIALANYPNPFNSSTLLCYDLQEPARVTLKIYNLRGQEICCLVDAWQSSGSHSYRWNGQNQHGVPVSSGVYVYCLWINQSLTKQKMLLIR